MILPQSLEHLLICMGDYYAQVLVWLADEQVYAEAAAGLTLTVTFGILVGFWWSTKFGEKSTTFKHNRYGNW